MLKVVTFNVQNDAFKKRNIYSWKSRFDLILDTIKAQDADVVGLQEVTISLRNKLKKELGDYHFYGKHRFLIFDEATTILVKKNICVKNGHTFYISKWGINIPRIATYLKVLIGEKEIHLFNTHLDNKSKDNRLYQLNKLDQKLKKYKGQSIIVLGDFNMTATNLEAFASNNVLIDLASSQVTKTLRTSKQQLPIDHILVTKDFVVKDIYVYQTGKDNFYPSDHYPLVASLEL